MLILPPFCEQNGLSRAIRGRPETALLGPKSTACSIRCRVQCEDHLTVVHLDRVRSGQIGDALGRVVEGRPRRDAGIGVPISTVGSSLVRHRCIGGHSLDKLGGASVPNRTSDQQNTDRVPPDLRRPDHLEDEAWEAIQVHVRRLEGAQTSADAGWVIGCSKDLIECVARVVLDAKGVSLAGTADFDEAVNAAHMALERQPGRDVSMSPDIRAIAGSAKKMVLNVRRPHQCATRFLRARERVSNSSSGGTGLPSST